MSLFLRFRDELIERLRVEQLSEERPRHRVRRMIARKIASNVFGTRKAHLARGIPPHGTRGGDEERERRRRRVRDGGGGGAAPPNRFRSVAQPREPASLDLPRLPARHEGADLEADAIFLSRRVGGMRAVAI